MILQLKNSLQLNETVKIDLKHPFFENVTKNKALKIYTGLKARESGSGIQVSKKKNTLYATKIK